MKNVNFNVPAKIMHNIKAVSNVLQVQQLTRPIGKLFNLFHKIASGVRNDVCKAGHHHHHHQYYYYYY